MSQSQPLHIGVVAHALNHNNIGRVYPFLQAFVGAPDVRCTLIGWDATGTLFPLLRDLPWPIRRLRGPRHGRAAERALAEALQSCDLVHCFKHREHFPTALAAATALRMPLVLDIDDWELGLYLEGVTRWPGWRQALSGGRITRRLAQALELEHLARTAPDALVVNSRALQAHFGGQIVYTAADAAAFDPAHADGAAFRRSHGLALDAPVIGFLGTPHPHKGIDELLAAFAIIRSETPQARLLFVGVPPQNPYAARLRQTDGVLALGYIPADAYPAAYAACDLVAIPQRAVTEGIMQTPAKLILAMAAARPIVATTVGDMPQILGDAGVLVPPENVAALAAALAATLADTPGRARLGALARTRFLADSTLAHTAGTMRAIYREAIAQRNA